ncbi:Venom carboxylesterase-6 [Gryllus bimaculatus]|nr:Venom carboxylesterase-6 [Gryllus bimaculatus]
MEFKSLFLLLLVIAGHVTHGGYHVVFTEVSEGRLRGITGRSAGGRMFYAYKGIPYASPPVGPLRWQPPQPPKPWHGVRSATHDGPACPQYIILTENYVGEEDCLYLNVYVPPGATHAPIIVWIHGGAFTAGSGRQDHYNPDFLLDLDVVVVTVNYRLGALGFLSTGDELLPGNYGLKDQAAALRWLQRNAHAFGGDPGRVTLLGQSSGAACVTMHLLSPQSRGLFSGVAALSGSAIAAWAVARVVGCAKKDGRDDDFKTPQEMENEAQF